jgi:pSer/pThr/pTyr-binding forkhead associated (FHA) protein
MSNSNAKNQQYLVVGTAPDADIVIDQPTVSRRHCSFQWRDGTWELTDLGSTNGTFVNGQRISSPQTLNPNDSVTLGRGVACPVPAAPKLAAPKPSRVEPSVSQAASISKQVNQTAKKKSSPVGAWLTIGTSLVMSVITISILYYKMNGSRESGTTATQETASVAATNSKSDSEPGEKTVAKLPGPVASPASDKAAEAASKIAAELDSTWAVVVQSADKKSQKLVGTAVAIEGVGLLTMASIVDAVQAVKDVYPNVVFVQSQAPERELTAASVELHPKYKTAIANFEKFDAELQERLKKIDSLQDPSLDESLQWSERFEKAIAEVAAYDLALWRTNKTLENGLKVSSSNQGDSPRNVRVLGYPMITPSPEVTNNFKVFRLDLPAVTKRVQAKDGMISVVESSGLLPVSLVSMICQDEDGAVSGIIVRQETAENPTALQRAQMIPIEAFWK